MGMFLAMSSVIGKSEKEVVRSLSKYVAQTAGGLAPESLSPDDDQCCVIETAEGNTTVYYPNDYLEWDETSEFISMDLDAPVFSFHIHDGDLWMYVFFVNGEIADQFNPLPDYWNENIGQEELAAWQGDAATICTYIPSLKQAGIENYLVRWDLDSDQTVKAYPDDEYSQEDWQLLDFMKKLKLPYPLAENGTPKGHTYRLYTRKIPPSAKGSTPGSTRSETDPQPKKPWWKIW